MRRRLPAATLVSLLLLAPAIPAQYVWDGGLSHANLTVSNNWSVPNNWVGQNPPPSTPNVDITFTQSGIRTTANQNIATPFQLHSITFDSNNTNFTEIDGFPLDFHTNGSSVLPAINQNSSVNVTISNNINMTNSLTIGGGGSGSLTFTGPFTGPGSLTTTANSVILSSSGTNVPVVTATSGALTFNGGSYTINGNSFPFNCGTGSGAPVLTINNGASVNVPSTDVNGGITVAGPAGTAMIVDGGNTKLSSGSYIVVGYGSGGQGQLTVQNGASVVETTQSLEVGTFSGDNGQVLIQSGGTITTTNVILGVQSGSAGTITVTGAGSSLVVSGSTLLSFTNGNGNLVVKSGASAALNGGVQFGQDPSVLAVNGGTVTTPSITAANPPNATVQVSDPQGGVALTINPGSATTYAGAITDAAGGPGTVVKIGGATLTLTGHLTNTGGYTASAGSIEFRGAVVQPGFGGLTAAAGATLQYDNNSRIFGGFLYGPGSHVVSSAAFTGTTAVASATINVAGAGASFTSFSNGGNLSIAGGLPPTAMTGFTNQGSGSITVGAGSKVNGSSFQSYGTLTLVPGSTGAATQLTNTGTTPLYFNGGSRTFIGTPQTAGQNAALVDLHGQNALVAGGLFVNNGFVGDSTGSGATIVADYGALVKGAGIYANSVVTQNGGKFQAGNSPGESIFGQLVLGPGGTQNFNWQINNAAGVWPFEGPDGLVSGWSLLHVTQIVDPLTGQTTTGNLNWTATNTPGNQFNMSLQTLINPIMVGQDTLGLMANFNGFNPPGGKYVWKFLDWAGTYSGPTDDATLTNTVLFDTSNFLNPIDPVYGKFGLHYNGAAKEIDVVYSVPEPGTLALTGLAGLLWSVGSCGRRRRAVKRL